MARESTIRKRVALKTLLDYVDRQPTESAKIDLSVIDGLKLRSVLLPDADKVPAFYRHSEGSTEPTDVMLGQHLSKLAESVIIDKKAGFDDRKAMASVLANVRQRIAKYLPLSSRSVDKAADIAAQLGVSTTETPETPETAK
jgi:hypothetical protein